jgi:endonuclease/exonuclease/phosphatase family metal-dependent hydrolase
MIPLKALVAVVAVAAVAIPVSQARQSHPSERDTEVTVMTRNMFLGTDLKPIFNATSQPALFAAVGAGWAEVQSNDIPTRAKAMAREIASDKPELVGLQEAMLFQTDMPPDGPATPAGTTAYDFVGLLVDELADRGLEYEPVSVFSGTDAELPSGLPPTQDVRLRDRVVVLVRRDGHGKHELETSNPQSGRYAAAITVPTAAGPITLPRGWASVDVTMNGRSFRFVTTHLEAFSSQIRNPQATELAAGPTATSTPVVLVGDFNSRPGTDTSAYGILGGAGFTDAWQGADGLTCCHAVDLHNPDPTLTKRVDLVLTKGGFETRKIEVVGEEPDDRVKPGLWPSDHAGVVAKLRLPGGCD